MGPYLSYLSNKVEKSAKILLNTEATPELLKSQHYDYIIVAIGSDPVIPKIKGVNQRMVIAAKDMRNEGVQLGNTVVVIGGGMTGCEIAI